MSRGPAKLHPLKGNQKRASDPGRHIWLSASAGTGKTQVLAARVWRLLLAGTDPSAILCLTFTKAGAAEMSERITGRLAYWVRAKDEELAADLAALGESIGPERRATARTLFAKVLDAPGGGIRIQTIHSFCQSLLAAFPIEAGLVPGFRPLEAREEAVLARETLAEMLVDARREGREGVIEAIGALSLRLGEGGAEGFLQECARAGEALEGLPRSIQPWLRRAFDLPAGDIRESLATSCGDNGFDVRTLRNIGSANAAWGTARGLDRADIIAAWLGRSPEERAATLDQLHLVWATAKGEPRSFAKGQAPQDPDYAEAAMRLHGRCGELLAMQVRAAYVDLLARGLEAGRDYARAYAAAKRRLGAVDFDDLIGRTIALLRQEGMGEWVRYKLDQVTEHVLIDEAQDTNPSQWAIVSAMADEFFAGEGARGDRLRTLFTVGDYKQAIFGFQGTDPIFFQAAFERFKQLANIQSDYEAELRELEQLSLTHSFRSTRPVLEFVDTALGLLPEPGMGPMSDREPHASEVPGPGTVTLWPPVIEGGSDADEESWLGDATRELAARIARAIKGWIGTLPLASKGRMLAPGDVMVLVKRRGELASLIVARLYAEGVPVAGVDRLRLNAPLAVQDLLAAIRFALQPEDDLSLASLLVSPLIGWSQDALMAGAVRERGGLWRHLRETQPAEKLAPLYDLLRRADLATPYRFLEELLSGPMQGRRKLLTRLGEEARDPIEELLNAALTFETRATPSLQRFLDWFDRGDVEIVRDAAQPQPAVRVMTAHGSKGLQAPLVILADATVDPTRSPRSFLKWAPEGDEKLPIFRPRSAERDGALAEALAEADARELQEHWRLFYVAATRAEERLVIAGALGPQAKGEPPKASWYAASAAALDALGVPADEAGVRAFHGVVPQAPVRAVSASPAEPPASRPVLPGWLHAPAPQEARPPRPLAPSSLGDDRVADPPPGPALRAAAERGRLLHALFERLPGVSPSERRGAADRWLAGAGGLVDAGERAALIDSALAVTEDPRFAELFGPDALGEAPIAAVVAEGVVVSGTVDRLVVLPDRVRVVDFKTGRRAPASLEDVPPYHLRQMSAYVAALRVIFPERAVEAALLYSAGPVLYALPEALLAAHKPGYAG
ncbi:ATP-dependent helicase/nuclease subunit A [Sphingomonas sp. S2M10]|uniref:double-strand break repair helicase AddA n=1 Tax=Sphingomonas sp. S2M10 TaxID=2705010 RepID=UPI001456D7A2|nr:double-strand break repair helicase AddA [Sphingomonas sp. S2M10]NLS26963.1 ATP-dependent helicase/nuclease subunit A [Sphingomonas sp. S2M10]